MNDNVCMQIYENKNYRFNYDRILRFFFNLVIVTFVSR